MRWAATRREAAGAAVYPLCGVAQLKRRSGISTAGEVCWAHVVGAGLPRNVAGEAYIVALAD